MRQDIRFCRTAKGVSIAYSRSGSGPPLVKAANWLNHLEFDQESPIWRHWLEELARTHEVVRYDERGNGLSDWEVPELSFESWVRDLETVVDAVGLERFALLGISQGGPVAIAYAVRHPERVSHLVLYGSYARGWNRRPEQKTATAQREALRTLTLHGWGQDNPAFRQVWTSQFVPGATLEQMSWFNELQRISTSPENAVRFLDAFGEIEVTDLLPRVRTPTLILHCRDDAAVPFDEGRRLARSIPDARFVPLEGRNHLLLEKDAAWQVFLYEVRNFLGVESDPLELPTGRMRSPPPVPPMLSSGERLGRYRIERHLGSGGMGAVYEARDERLGRSVALKVLLPHVAPEHGADRLLREARTAASLSHPGICTVHDVDEVDGVAFLAMELLDGAPLDRVLREEGAQPAREVARIGREIAEALDHAHRQGVIHRDLKAGNVARLRTGPIKVLDFGLAKVLDGVSDVSGTLTATGVLSGTVPYMAPEQLRGDPLDSRCDLWALGVLLHELLTGKRPFRGLTPFAVTAAILRGDPVPPPEDAPEPLQRVIAGCLRKEPEERWGAAEEIVAALAGAV